MAVDELHPVIAHHVVNTLQWSMLRPLQQSAVGPVTRGEDCLLLAPTAGGKTEAAMLPLLSRMQNENWTGISVLYLCPLKALLNNLQPRLDGYTSWLGRRARTWHGDTTATARRAILNDRPDVLLTTPESLEAMLVSARVDPHDTLSTVRAVVVDEIHAFAGDDRGVHLRSVLDRVARLAGHPVQRIGLSATVGNPDELLHWLQGPSDAVGRVITPDLQPVRSPAVGPSGTAVVRGGQPADTSVTVDYVGSMENAATVIVALHRGDKKLIFVDSRRDAEHLAAAINESGVRAFVSHSSLSAQERHRTEAAFAETTNCVIVATSTLELGIDVGDVDGIVQIGSPDTVASFLQRLGRSGRRAGTTRSMLFLCPDEDAVHIACALLLLWREGYVEPISPPPVPRHLLAQQLLALCLQEGRIGRNAWREWLAGFDAESLTDGPAIVEHLQTSGHLDSDQGMLFLGPEADEKFGRFYFRDLVSSFTSAPQFAVFHGRHLLGTVDPMVVTRRVAGPRRLLLAGRSWQVRDIDWNRKRLYVEASDVVGSAQWFSPARAQSFALTDAMRRVALGADPQGVSLSDRARRALALVRTSHEPNVESDATVLVARDARHHTWWTWAGGRGNLTLAAALDAVDPGLVAEDGRTSDFSLRIAADAGPGRLRSALRALSSSGLERVVIAVDPGAIRGLKFGDLLPEHLAIDTVSRRMLDRESTGLVIGRPIVDRTTE